MQYKCMQFSNYMYIFSSSRLKHVHLQTADLKLNKYKDFVNILFYFPWFKILINFEIQKFWF